jgi:hypothetical protein
VPNYISYQQLRYRNLILQPATFFKRSVLASTPLDSELDFAFDWDFWIRLTRDYNVLAVDRVWAGYRMWGENKTARGDSARTREQALVVERYLGFLSWQHILLRVFYQVYRLAEIAPEPGERRLKQGVRLLARAIGLMSHGRFPRI